MTTYIQVLAQDCQYHAACISVGTENHRYLIEAGEGAQRLAVEHKVRIGKVGGVFLTSYRPCSVGGLPGMLLTLDDAGINTVNIYGPAKAQQYLQATKYFMRSLGQYQSIPYSSTQQPPNVIRKADLSFFPIPIRSAHSVAEDDCETVSYLMETPKIPGKFFVDKAAELGIPKGPLFGKLKSGHSITLPNGNVVHPDQVLGEPTLPKYFAVISRIDSSDELSMKCLNESMILQRFMKPTVETNDYISLMIHMSDHISVDTEVYQRFIQQFGLRTKHLFIGRGCNRGQSSFIAQTFYNAQLHRMFGSVFPSIVSSSTEDDCRINSKLLIQQEDSTEMTDNDTVLMHPSSPLVKYHFLPVKKEGFEWFNIPSYEEDVDKFLEELQQKQPELLQKVEALQAISTSIANNTQRYPHGEGQSEREKQDNEELLAIDGQDRIVFLGTGCAIPSKYRNVSSILLYLKGNDNSSSSSGILLDAGEGTWNQLLHLTPPNAYEVDGNVVYNKELLWALLIKVIWISHPHADHHLGIVSIIQERSLALLSHGITDSPLVIIAPFSVWKFLEDCCVIYPEITAWFVFVPTKYFEPVEFCLTCNNSSSSATTNSASATNNIDTKGEIAPSNNGDTQQEGDGSSGTLAKKPRLAGNSNDSKGRFYPPIPTDSDTELVESVRKQLLGMGIEDLRNVPVVHCSQAYGVILTIRNNNQASNVDNNNSATWKLVYSGDTRPCDNLIQYGRGATVLIHEATFEDDKVTEAMNKRHSTICEAEQVCDEMGANRLIMTHFSQRYHGVPSQFHPTMNESRNDDGEEAFEASLKRVSKNTNNVIAFDFMSMSIPDLVWTTKLTPLLAEIFPAEEIEDTEEDQTDQTTMMLG